MFLNLFFKIFHYHEKKENDFKTKQKSKNIWSGHEVLAYTGINFAHTRKIFHSLTNEIKNIWMHGTRGWVLQ